MSGIRAGRLLAVGLIAAGLTIAAATARSNSPSAGKLTDGGKSGDWPGYGNTFGEQHYSPLDQISDRSVTKLGLAWSIDLPPANSVTAPLAVDGRLFYVTGYSVVHAVDGATGKPLWDYDPEVYKVADKKLRVGWGARGIAWWNGKIYVGGQDGRLIAIDAKTGKPVWTAQTLPPDDMTYLTGAPRVFDGKVIIGFGGADVGPARGYVSTYDAETGKLLWRFYTVPGNPAIDRDETTRIAAKSWAGQWWKYGGGGTAWNAMAYDPETDTVFVGTGNGSPWNRKARSQDKGDNLFLCSIVALDAKTGRYKWHYQANPGETWDYNAVMDIELATLEIQGKPRKVLMQVPKNGFFYVIDRITGKLISAEPIAKVSWASKIDLATGRPVENPMARYPNGSTFLLWPSGSGAHSWNPMAFSPKTGLAYVPIVERVSAYRDFAVKNEEWRKLQPIGTLQSAAIGDFIKSDDPIAETSRLEAWDPATQKRRWAQPTPGNLNGGIMATAGNLVFQGRIDGHFNAYAAGDGKLLWSFDARAPVMAPPISFSAGGKQYVTVLSGYGTSGGLFGDAVKRFRIDYRTMPRRVLTFAIGGTKALPPRGPDTITPIADPDYRADPASEVRGNALYHGRCVQCHGINVVAAGSAPDLRTSPIPLAMESFRSVVHDGALLPSGMPRFVEYSDAELADIRQFIRARGAAWRSGAAEPASHKVGQ